MKTYISKKGPLPRSTPKAYAFERAGFQKDIWLPKSQVKVSKKPDGTYEIRIPHWLVKSKRHNRLQHIV